MNKKLIFSFSGVFLFTVLLIGTFFVMPKATQAKAPYTPIVVTQPGQCAQLEALYDTQTCIMTVALSQSTTHNVSFHVTYTGVWCYDKCYKESSVGGVGLAFPQGSTLTLNNTSVPIVIVAPPSIHGILTIPFVITGPSNTIKTQLIVSNTCC